MTLVEKYDHPAALLADCEAFLLADLPANNRLYNVLRRATAGQIDDAAPYYCRVRDADGATIGVGVVISPAPLRRLLLAGSNATLVAPLIAQIRVDGVLLTQVEGLPELAGHFAQAWGPHALNFRYGNLRLAEGPHGNGVSGQLRPAQPSDAPLLCDWLPNFMRDCGLKNDPARVPADVAERLARPVPHYWIWENDGSPRAMAAATGDAQLYRIGAVYTPAPFRGQGHAGAMMAALCRQLRAQGVAEICLFTDLRNPTSNGVYRRVGFAQVGECVEYDLH